MILVLVIADSILVELNIKPLPTFLYSAVIYLIFASILSREISHRYSNYRFEKIFNTHVDIKQAVRAFADDVELEKFKKNKIKKEKNERRKNTRSVLPQSRS